MSPCTYWSNTSITPGSKSLARSVGYDAAGNTTADSVRTMTCNAAGRMTSYVKGGTTTALTYNALGQRATKSNISGTHYFVYDEAGHVIGEYDGSGALFQEAAFLGDIPIAALWPAAGGGVTVTYVHTDHLNTPRAIMRRSDNAVIWRWIGAGRRRRIPFSLNAAANARAVLREYWIRDELTALRDLRRAVA